MAVHDRLDYECINCGEHWPQGACPATFAEHVVETHPCPDHPMTKCDFPGERLFDPYSREVQ
jgi:hypothetical protein